MPNRSSKAKISRDINQLASNTVGEVAGSLPAGQPVGKNPHAAALGRLGGAKGGPARAMKLSAERRSEIAQKAAQARWQGKREAQGDR